MYIHIYNDSVKRCIYVCIVYVCIYVCMRVCLHVYSHVFVLLASIHIRLPQTYTHTPTPSAHLTLREALALAD